MTCWSRHTGRRSRTRVIRAKFSEFLLRPRIRLDFAQMAREWKAISPSKRLVIVAYDDPSVRRDVLAAFLRIVGVDATRLEPMKHGRTNESIPAFVCQLIKQLRLDGRSDEEVGRWAAWAVRLGYDKSVNDKYGLLPADARDQLTATYMQEVISIARDPALKPSVLGDLGGRSSTPAPRVIATASDALIALGNEVGAPG